MYSVDPDNFASVSFTNQCQQKWYNQYGGYIVETTWDPSTNNYNVKRFAFNDPPQSTM